MTDWKTPRTIIAAGIFILFGIAYLRDADPTELRQTLRDAFMLAMFYYFGTTASSQRKTEIMARKSDKDDMV